MGFSYSRSIGKSCHVVLYRRPSMFQPLSTLVLPSTLKFRFAKTSSGSSPPRFHRFYFVVDSEGRLLVFPAHFTCIVLPERSTERDRKGQKGAERGWRLNRGHGESEAAETGVLEKIRIENLSIALDSQNVRLLSSRSYYESRVLCQTHT